MVRRLFTLVFLTVLGLAIAASSASAAPFGLSSFGVTFTDQSGSIVTQAGSHPFAMTTTFTVNTEARPGGGVQVPAEFKDLEVSQIPGFVGNPTAVPPCQASDFLTRVFNSEGKNIPNCPDDSAIGVILVEITNVKGLSPFWSSVYNLEAPPGKAAKIGLWADGVPVTLELGVSEKPPYEIIGGPQSVSQVLEIVATKLILWGVPADPVHDPIRGKCAGGAGAEPTSLGNCPSDVPVKPFLTLPRSCGAPAATSYALDSWQNPGARLPDHTPDLADPNWVTGSVGMEAQTGCADLVFNPDFKTRPTEAAAESPTGLDADLDVSDPGLTEPDGIAGSDIEKAVVTLPAGITTNPSVAAGLMTCNLPQYEEERLGGSGGCPEASKIGTVEVESPLLEVAGGGALRTLHGRIYVAKQRENPFDSLLAIYMVIEEPELGIFIKIPGHVEPDAATGQLTTTFADLPQLPFSHFHLHFRAGRRAPLVTPATCGTYSAEAALYPYANPGQPVHITPTFTISAGANGGPCAANVAELPNTPSFSAGSVDQTAGAFSPFVLRLGREDGSQQLRRITTTLPPGLLAKLAGIPYCSEGGIAQAAGRTGEGQGALERSSPSCPQASEVGTVTVAAGAGPEPLYVSGHAYLAGPYDGAPLSLEIVTPAIAGPFDLGVVAVRTALRVDPITSQVTAISDPIPTILHGLPLDVRSVAIDMRRPHFTLNPTNCEPMALGASVTTTVGQTAVLGNRYQVANCGALKFKPKLKISLKGSTKHTGHPALKAVVTYPRQGAYANIARAQVNLPHSEFLDQGNLNKTCTKPVLLAGNCPKSTVYGKVKAWTPLLDKPLQGKVYLVGGFGFKLPALVAELNGQIRVLLVGKVDSGKNKGIRNTFELVPDAPVERFVLEMKGGKKYGLLENSENLCERQQRGIARFRAQNGRVLQWKPKIANGCKKGKKAHKKHGRKGGKR
jgi:hypothetical protein